LHSQMQCSATQTTTMGIVERVDRRSYLDA
jgi:hypothetical protein